MRAAEGSIRRRNTVFESVNDFEVLKAAMKVILSTKCGVDK